MQARTLYGALTRRARHPGFGDVNKLRVHDRAVLTQRRQRRLASRHHGHPLHFAPQDDAHQPHMVIEEFGSNSQINNSSQEVQQLFVLLARLPQNALSHTIQSGTLHHGLCDVRRRGLAQNPTRRPSSPAGSRTTRPCEIRSSECANRRLSWLICTPRFLNDGALADRIFVKDTYQAGLHQF